MHQSFQSVPRFPQEADCDLYREMIRRHGGGNSAAARYAEKVIGRVQGHSGGPSAAEMRSKWDATHPFGPSTRTFRPDDFAFAFAVQIWGEAAGEQCASLGMHPRWRSCVEGRFEADTVELRQLGYNAQIFTREMLGALIRAQLPGKLCEAATPAEWQRIVNTAVRLPDWVLDEPVPIEAGRPVQAGPPCGDPAAGCAPPAQPIRPEVPCAPARQSPRSAACQPPAAAAAGPALSVPSCVARLDAPPLAQASPAP